MQGVLISLAGGCHTVQLNEVTTKTHTQSERFCCTTIIYINMWTYGHAMLSAINENEYNIMICTLCHLYKLYYWGHACGYIIYLW